MNEALEFAQELIDEIKKHDASKDYSKYKKEIAEHIDSYVFNGNGDTTFDFPDMDDFRLIQEDEYDQHMEEGNQDGELRPDYDFYVNGHYVIL